MGKYNYFNGLVRENGGEGGIRTPGTLARTPHFECGAIDHSATSPWTRERVVRRREIQKPAVQCKAVFSPFRKILSPPPAGRPREGAWRVAGWQAGRWLQASGCSVPGRPGGAVSGRADLTLAGVGIKETAAARQQNRAFRLARGSGPPDEGADRQKDCRVARSISGQ